MMNEMSMAARIIRIGNENSETNRKLMEAVSQFVVWLYVIVGDELYEYQETQGKGCQGWVLRKESNPFCIRLGFAYDGGWYSVYDISEYRRSVDATLFCKAIVGEQGERLVQWLVERNLIQQKALRIIETIRN